MSGRLREGLATALGRLTEVQTPQVSIEEAFHTVPFRKSRLRHRRQRGQGDRLSRGLCRRSVALNLTNRQPKKYPVKGGFLFLTFTDTSVEWFTNISIFNLIYK